jgi:hypothetical protein
MKYETSPLFKSQLYLEALPHFNRARVSIPNHELLLRELRGLERRVHRSGKDSVDHGAHGSDDCANCLAGCMYMAFGALRKAPVLVGTYVPSGRNGKISYSPKNNPWMEPDRPRLNVIHVDENGNELTSDEAAAVRHRQAARRTAP